MTTPQDGGNGSSQTGGHLKEDDQLMIDPGEVFTIMRYGYLEKTKNIQEFGIENYRTGASQEEINKLFTCGTFYETNLLK